MRLLRRLGATMAGESEGRDDGLRANRRVVRASAIVASRKSLLGSANCPPGPWDWRAGPHPPPRPGRIDSPSAPHWLDPWGQVARAIAREAHLDDASIPVQNARVKSTSTVTWCSIRRGPRTDGGWVRGRSETLAGIPRKLGRGRGNAEAVVHSTERAGAPDAGHVGRGLVAAGGGGELTRSWRGRCPLTGIVAWCRA